MHIRPFAQTEEDYAGIVAVHNAAWPDRLRVAQQWQHRDENRDPAHKFARFVAERDGRIVAYGSYNQFPWSYHPHKFNVDVVVRPGQRNQGIGSALYERLAAALAPLAPHKLTARTREDQATGRHFLAQRGFAVAMRYPLSELDSAQFNPGRFASTIRRVLDSGIAITTVAELMETDPDWKQKLYDLEWDIAEDIPTPDPLTPTGIADYEKNVLGHPTFMAEAYFVAIDGGRYVGMSSLRRNLATASQLETDLTGTRRAYRRRGIATALKVAGITFAKTHGGARILTSNEENNPMLGLNQQLGFIPLPAWLDYVKRLNGRRNER